MLSFRYEEQFCTLVSSNLTAKEIAEYYDERIADRFREMMLIINSAMSSHSENSKLIKNIMTMNTDYSYCSGVTCSIRKSCKRYLPDPPDTRLQWVWPAYNPETGKCKYYEPTKVAKTKNP